MEAIRCKKCNTELVAENVNIDLGLAKCHACNTIFYIKPPDYTQPRSTYTESTSYNPANTYRDSFKNVEKPKNVSLESDGSTMTISTTWNKIAGIFLVIFSAIWNSMIWGIFIPNFIPIGTEILTSSETAVEGFDFIGLVPLLFMGIFALVGVWLVYYALANLINKTKFKVGTGILQVTHGPLPLRRNRKLETHDIDQLYVKEIYHQRARSGTSTSSNYFTYNLYVIQKSGPHIRVMQSGKPEIALYF
jgi:phage FluMu protein Com